MTKQHQTKEKEPDMSNNTTMDKITAQLDKAEAAADRARQKARELQAEHDQLATEAAAKDNEKRARFDAHRQTTFPATFGRAVRDARKAFNTTVAEGGDVFAAWAHVQQAAARAAAETTRLSWATYQRAQAAYDTLHTQVQEWNTTLRRIEQAQRVSDSTPARQISPPIMFGTPTHEPAARALPYADQLAQLNTDINTALQQHDSSTRRATTDVSPVSMLDFNTTRPTRKLSETAGVERFEQRTFTQALDDAFALVRDTATAEHRQQVEADLAAFSE